MKQGELVKQTQLLLVMFTNIEVSVEDAEDIVLEGETSLGTAMVNEAVPMNKCSKKKKKKGKSKLGQLERLPGSCQFLDRRPSANRFKNYNKFYLWDVPEHLKQGGYYATLSLDDPDDYEIAYVPFDCRKPDTSVENLDDLVHLTKTLSFWSVECLPAEVYSFCLSVDDPTPIVSALEEYKVNFSFATTCLEILKEVQNSSSRFDKVILAQCLSAACEGNVNGLRDLPGGETVWLQSTAPANIAAAHGQLASLRFLCESNCKLDGAVGVFAIKNGHVNCWQYLTTVTRFTSTVEISFAGLVAAKLKRYDMLNFFHDQEQPWSANVLQVIVEHGDLEQLQIMTNHACDWSLSVSDAAIRTERQDILLHVVSSGCPIHAMHMEQAAREGRLSFLRELHYDAGASLPPGVLVNAARRGDLELMQFALEGGCEWTPEVTRRAAEMGHLGCLQYAHTQGCAWDADTPSAAAGRCHWTCVLYAVEHGCPVDVKCLCEVADSGEAEILKQLFDLGAPRNYRVLKAAVRNLACLQCAHECGCDWPPRSDCFSDWKPECLLFALQNGLDSDSQYLLDAVRKECEEIVVHLVQHGVTFDLSASLAVARRPAFFPRLFRKLGEEHCVRLLTCLIDGNYLHELKEVVDRFGYDQVSASSLKNALQYAEKRFEEVKNIRYTDNKTYMQRFNSVNAIKRGSFDQKLMLLTPGWV